THGNDLERTDVAVSSLVDTWLVLREVEVNGERNRTLYVIKSRGMAHSHQLREVLVTNEGIRLVDVYLGPGGTLTGAARLAQEAQERASSLIRQQEVEHRRRDLEKRRQALEARIEALRLEFDVEAEEAERIISQELIREDRLREDRIEMARRRGVDLEESLSGE
ncbi:MAG: KaiC 1, partial [Thermoanaerobaculia bacterium]